MCKRGEEQQLFQAAGLKVKDMLLCVVDSVTSTWLNFFSLSLYKFSLPIPFLSLPGGPRDVPNVLDQNTQHTGRNHHLLPSGCTAVTTCYIENINCYTRQWSPRLSKSILWPSLPIWRRGRCWKKNKEGEHAHNISQKWKVYYGNFQLFFFFETSH